MLGIVEKAVRWVCSFALALMATIVFIQVINRNIFDNSFKWVEELSTMCMVCITFLGAVLASVTNAHTRIELFVTMLPKKLSFMVFALGDAACGIFSLLLCDYSYPLIMANLHTMSPAMKLPLAINYLVFAAATVLIALFYFLKAREDFKKAFDKSGTLSDGQNNSAKEQ